jgi:hypothetical protein
LRSSSPAGASHTALTRRNDRHTTPTGRSGGLDDDVVAAIEISFDSIDLPMESSVQYRDWVSCDLQFSLLNHCDSKNQTSCPAEKVPLLYSTILSLLLPRASKLLNELKNEEFNNLKQGRKWPAFRAGDAIEIKVLSLSPDS